MHIIGTSRYPAMSIENQINSTSKSVLPQLSRTRIEPVVQALGLLVSLSSIHYCTYTCDLSTRSLRVTLPTSVVGYLILRWASRLDAFSVYPIRTRLLSYALGSTTDAPVVRPTRSSRTKVSSFQISCAHDR